MKIKTQYLILITLLFSLSIPSFAALNLMLTRGINGAIPIAIVPFTNLNTDNPVSNIVRQDLQMSGRFKVVPLNQVDQAVHRATQVNLKAWRKLGVDYVVVGKRTVQSNGEIAVNFALLSVFNHNMAKTTPLIQGSYQFPITRTRFFAHQISNKIYQQLTGNPGVFTTKIAYVEVLRQPKKATRYLLQVADYDGFNPQTIVNSPQPLMSPAWSPQGDQIAYVSFESGHAQIYISNIYTGKRQLVSNYPGINGAPAWSPDGKRLALVLSKSGHPKIYVLNLASKKLTQITHGYSIDTEPSFSPNGQSIIFTSDRGGHPQIYQANLATQQVTRLTFTGNYNARASYTPNGQDIVMLHRGELGGFNIGLLNLTNGQYSVLTQDGQTESPTIAPNGRMILYATTRSKSGREILSIVSTDGKVALKLPAKQGAVREPAWSPFIG